MFESHQHKSAYDNKKTLCIHALWALKQHLIPVGMMGCFISLINENFPGTYPKYLQACKMCSAGR